MSATMSTGTRTTLVDRGNRAFWSLVGVVVGFRGLLMVLTCCVVCVVVAQLLVAGVAALFSGLLPAALLAILLIVTAIAAMVCLGKELRATYALHRTLRSRAVAADAQVLQLAAQVGLADRVTVVEANEPFAFTHGLLVPRVVLSNALLETLDPEELLAVLAHEAAHVRSRDPLKVLVARVLVAREFYLPVLRHLSRRFVAGRELAADRHAISRCGTHPVAGALFQAIAPPSWAAATPAAAMASAATLDVRIGQLETGTEPPPPPAPHRLVLGSAMAATLLLAAAANAALLIQQLCMRGM